MKWSDVLVLLGFGLVVGGVFTLATWLGLVVSGGGLMGFGFVLGKVEDGARHKSTRT